MLKSEEIIEILSPLNFWGKPQEIGVARTTYQQKTSKILRGESSITALIGVRRAGKTTLAKQLLASFPKEQTLYVLLEDPKFDLYLGTTLLDEIYQATREEIFPEGEMILVLDEVQNVPLWEKWARTFLEKKEKAKLIVTGSSSKLLASRLATLLTGRTLTMEIFPLNFQEYLSFKGISLKKKYEIIGQRRELQKRLQTYLSFGGFPQVVLEKDPVLKTQHLRDIFEGIIYRDVAARHHARDSTLVKTIAEIAINTFASLGSASKIKNVAGSIVGRKVSPNTVVQILSHLEEAYLIFQIPIFSYKIKDQKLYPKKFYCVDPGLINTITFKFSENIGRLYENVVAIFLIQQKGKTNIFYWNARGEGEVDFVIKKGLKIHELIQVCYDLSSEKTKQREVNALLKAAQELRCRKLLILTRDESKEEVFGSYKIVYQPLWRWLLHA